MIGMLSALRKESDLHTSGTKPRRAHGCTEQQLANGPLLIDVGANIGMYSLAAAAACFEAIAFEPVPANAQRILLSAERNGFVGRVRNGEHARLHLYILGASDTFGTAAMGLSATNQGAVAHEPSSGPSSAVSGRMALVNIALAPLDRVLGVEVARSAGRGDREASHRSSRTARRPRAVFLKLDVEGAECRALRGMRRFLANAAVRLVGALIETGHNATRQCCDELLHPPNGAFHVLHTRHGLCARDHGNGDLLVPFEDEGGRSLCRRSIGAINPKERWPWELSFAPCAPAVPPGE